MSQDGEDYFLPLEDQRAFGAGIRRKRVPFVRSSEHELNTTTTTAPPAPQTSSSGTSIADRYLSIVLPKKPEQSSTPPQPAEDAKKQQQPEPTAPAHCEVCNLPLEPNPEAPYTDSDNATPASKPHESSLAHQVCLAHSHPPSHLDRTRHGLRYLSTYGWDPDSRMGLGMPGREGIREPVKGRLKVDTVGLGVKLPGRDGDDDDEGGGELRKKKERERRARRIAETGGGKRVEKLNAKDVRRGDLESRRRGDKLREMFYQSEDLQRYLG